MEISVENAAKAVVTLRFKVTAKANNSKSVEKCINEKLHSS